jgi:hypothetical protein
MYETYGEKVAFLLVYIREAHPTGDARGGANRREGIAVDQPQSHQERKQVAATMCEKLDISLPTVIDNLDDQVSLAYNAFPDRIYLVGRGGKIVYQGGPGPFGFAPAELQTAIEKVTNH